jgi:hypothetical protein
MGKDQEKKVTVGDKSVTIKIDSDASNDEIMQELAKHLNEFRTEAKLAKGQIVMQTEDKQH